MHKYRILALLFFATTINYLDRSIIGVLGPTLRDRVFHWSMSDYGLITTGFQLAYAVGLLGMGALIDLVGVRSGALIAITIWSTFGLLHSTISPAYGLIGFFVVRFGLGLGEAGCFPANIKAVAEWFPQNERAFATGIFNAGSNVGAILAPTLIPLLVSIDGTGWRWPFFIGPCLSLIWIFFWLRTYRSPETSHATETRTRVAWRALIPHRETWAFAILKTTDAVWWFYLFWGGMFLSDRFHLDLKRLGLPLIIVYVVADLGSVFGGWLSGALLKHGYTVNAARKIALLTSAFCIFPVAFATRVENPWIAVALIALAAGGHQSWSANAFTFVSDIFPKKAVASVVGLGGMVGALTSVAASLTLGHVLVAGDGSSYAGAFLIAGCLYGLVLGIAHLLVPEIKSVQLVSGLRPIPETALR